MLASYQKLFRFLLMLLLVSKNCVRENEHTVKFHFEDHGPVNVATQLDMKVS